MTELFKDKATGKLNSQVIDVLLATLLTLQRYDIIG
jgi:hypothetical protein